MFEDLVTPSVLQEWRQAYCTCACQMSSSAYSLPGIKPKARVRLGRFLRQQIVEVLIPAVGLGGPRLL